MLLRMIGVPQMHGGQRNPVMPILSIIYLMLYLARVALRLAVRHPDVTILAIILTPLAAFLLSR